MKFLCDNCKAKYQIGDDKVAGKTVRMKCRRCGFDIHVNASTIVEETSAAPWPDASATMQGSMAIVTPELAASLGLTPPGAPRPADASSIPKPTIPRAVPAPRAPIAAPTPQAAAPQPDWNQEGGEIDDESTAIMTIPLRVAVAAAKAATSAGAPSSAAPSAATPSARPLSATPRPATAATPRPAPAATPRPAALAPRPGAPRPGGASPEPVPAASTSARPAPGGVAGAFARAARAPEPAAASIPQDGWYVGIAGTPFGPASLDAIREKCRAGDIHPESLVWRDGQGEWQPLRTFPALFAMFNAVNADNSVNADSAASTDSVASAGNAADAARVASLASNVPAATPTPAPYASPTEAEPPAAAPDPSPEPPYAVSAFASPMGRGSAATAVLTDVFPDRAGNPFAALGLSTGAGASSAPPSAAPVAALADPFAPPAPTVPPPDAAAAAPGPSKAPSSPDSAASGFASGPTGVPVDIDDAVPPQRRSQPHPMAYAFIAFAAVFGGVAAYVLLSKPPAPIVVVQAAPSAVVAAPPPSSDKPQASAEVAVGEITTDSSGAPVVRQGGPLNGPKPKSSAGAVAAPIDTSGFTSTIPGPSTAVVPPTNAGSQLSAGEIQGVVAQNQSIVKRKCWQPALESRAANAPSNARVNGSITIGAGGNVESASASGGERDFPGLASCIASRMKGWKFPPSSGSTPVNVPFVFAGQ
jgi:predicted Zn finger-like uncharacterized protein